MNFQCPESMRAHARKVLAGEYDVPGIDAPTLVLDIGANVGAFAVWAVRKWPGATVTCYEPEPDNFMMLEANTVNTGTMTLQAAVYCEGQLRMHRGKNNCGEHSLWRGPEQSHDTFDVPGISPTQLPLVDFLKIDAEGAELAIVTGYPHLASCRAVALEWHSEDQRWLIRKFLMAKDFQIVGDEAWREDRGILKARRA